MSDDIHGHGENHMPLVEYKSMMAMLDKGYPISDEMREEAVKVTAAFLRSGSPKYRRAGVEGLAKLDRLNVAREALTLKEKPKPHLHIHANASDFTDEQLAAIAAGGSPRTIEAQASTQKLPGVHPVHES